MAIGLGFISLIVNCGTMIHLQDQKKNFLNGGKIKDCILLISPIETSLSKRVRVEADQWLGYLSSESTGRGALMLFKKNKYIIIL